MMEPEAGNWPSSSSPPGRDIINGILDLLDTATAKLKAGSVAPAVHANEIDVWLEGFTFEESQDPLAVARATLDLLSRANVHTIHPRYFGLFNPAPMIWGEIADMISARLNPQLATWSHAPAAVEVEQHALRFLARRIGFEEAAAFFTTGGEEANRCGVQLGLVRSFPAYSANGLRSLPNQPVFYVSAQSHLAWIKIGALLGLGRSAVRLVPVDENLRMDPNELSGMIAADRSRGLAPFFIGATAGTTSAGIIDPLAQLADIAGSEGLHLHVDAAWAGAVVLSDRWRGLLTGIERADSVTIDAHKWLSQPLGTGMFFSRDIRAPAAAFDVSAAYMPTKMEGRIDYYAVTPTWSRRWLGLRLFLSLAAAGRAGFEAQIHHDMVLGEYLRDRLRQRGWICLNRTELPVVCFSREGRQSDEEWHRTIANRVTGSGKAWISTVKLEKSPAIRACITNWQSRRDDVDGLIYALDEALDSRC